MPAHRIVHIEMLAPRKPEVGAPCNGCGICCLAEPCPVGVLLFRRRSGACAALVWEPEAAVYRCGAIVRPRAIARSALPGYFAWLVPVLARVLSVGARR